MDEVEYQKLLDQHDWFYMMSDDHKVFTKGNNNHNMLIQLSRQNSKFGAMYEQKYKEVWKK